MPTTTTFVWDPVNDCVISELDGTGATQAVYTNEPQKYGGVLSQRRGSTSRFLHADALGTTRLLTSTAGVTTDTYLFDAWGNPVSSTGSTVNPFRWVGRYGYYTDNATGLVYVRARMYAPTIAVWVSMDPIGFDSGDVLLYRYVSNYPLQQTDPSGLIEPVTCGVLLICGIIIGSIAGCSSAPPPLTNCLDGTTPPTPPSTRPATPLPPWATKTVDCDPPKGEVLAQTACGPNRGIELRLCNNVFGSRPHKSKCLTGCLVNKEEYSKKLLYCYVSKFQMCGLDPATGLISPGGTKACSDKLDCMGYENFWECIDSCKQNGSVDPNDEIVERLRQLKRKSDVSCSRISGPVSDYCRN
ncbi:MAG: RHS repeat-associated core domain-containing protein [Planctomyces sp.]|nr:RHS repeat-associated core domain-containing protein [Planctomyces sp.]